jgi:hypothetical protein
MRRLDGRFRAAPRPAQTDDGGPDLPGELQYEVRANELSDRFDFRGMNFCVEARFVYAAIYRRC